MLRKFLKNIAAHSPFALTKNEYYDRLTEKIIGKVCNKNSVCIDAGANQGKILSMFIRHCPQAVHYAFEPLPDLYFKLVRKYGSAAKIYKTALSDKKGTATFNHVTADAAYSSLKLYNNPESIVEIEVETDCLDNIIPIDVKVDLIKLDIEGGEYDALLGSQNMLTRCKPVILFEFGKGGSEAFNVTPEKMFGLFKSLGFQINLLNGFLNSRPALNYNAFNTEYERGKEYMFIAYAPMA